MDHIPRVASTDGINIGRQSRPDERKALLAEVIILRGALAINMGYSRGEFQGSSAHLILLAKSADPEICGVRRQKHPEESCDYRRYYRDRVRGNGTPPPSGASH